MFRQPQTAYKKYCLSVSLSLQSQSCCLPLFLCLLFCAWIVKASPIKLWATVFPKTAFSRVVTTLFVGLPSKGIAATSWNIRSVWIASIYRKTCSAHYNYALWCLQTSVLCICLQSPCGGTSHDKAVGEIQEEGRLMEWDTSPQRGRDSDGHGWPSLTMPGTALPLQN